MNSRTVVKTMVLICLFIASAPFTWAQAQSNARVHSPKKATIMSAILPGSGQAYNKKYWKIPIIYGGFAGLAYAISFNNKEYKIYKEAYKFRLDGDETTTDDYVGVYSNNDLTTLKDYYRRNRDLSIIGMGILYVLNIVDASVDAHLFDFNVNENLSMQIMPTSNPNLYAGIGVKFSIK
jgi:hypothetical protein